MRINFGDVVIGEVARDRIRKALNKNWVSEGDNVTEFEEKFANQFDYQYAVATSSGTDACTIACASLYDLGADRGDEIIVPALTFCATVNAILAAGFKPVFVDIDISTLNIDVNKIEAEITKRTRAIMPVHIMGKPCDMATIMAIAKANNLYVIEDCCEAHGARYNGKPVGSFGDFGCFSFYCAHVITSGEGGMVVTNSRDKELLLKSIKSHGRPFDSIYFDFQRFGLNSRMNDLTAAVGIEQVMLFEQTFKKRRDNLFILLKLLDDLRWYFQFIEEKEYEVVSPHAFPIILKNTNKSRDRLYDYLTSKGIQCKTLFGCLPTQHKAFEFLGYDLHAFPTAEFVGQQGLHFGIHQYLTNNDLHFISDVLHRYVRVHEF